MAADPHPSPPPPARGPAAGMYVLIPVPGPPPSPAPAPGPPRASAAPESAPAVAAEGPVVTPTTAEGVTFYGGFIQIVAPRSGGGNVAVVEQAGDEVKVTVNGQTATFRAGDVWQIMFTSAPAGNDTFTNNTAFNASIKCTGGHNRVFGGQGFNAVSLDGDFDVYDARGGFSYVWAKDGPHDIIPPYSNSYVTRYSGSGDLPW
jgi:hypothetical protein